jgi:hypothetical protein
LALFAALATNCRLSVDRFDLIIRGGQVIDGSGGSPQRADVAVIGDRIARVGDLSALAAGREGSWSRRDSSTCRGSQARRCLRMAMARAIFVKA